MAHHHSHSHGDHSHHSHAHGIESVSHAAFFWAVLCNVGFTVAEACYAFIANSMSLLSDAGHNLSDVFGLLLAWGANWLLTRPATERYSYGYKKTTILAALSNALLLIFATGIIAYESLLRLITPLPVTENIIIIIATLGIFVNAGTAFLFVKGSKEDLNIKSAFLHLASDALISLGVVITAFAVRSTQWLWLDPLAGLLIAIIILIGTWGLIRDSVNLIMDAVPRHIDQEKVRGYLSTIPGVTKIHDLHIWSLSTKEVALTAHLVVPEHPLTDDDYHKINTDLKERFSINHVTLQAEQGHIKNPCGLAETC